MKRSLAITFLWLGFPIVIWTYLCLLSAGGLDDKLVQGYLLTSAASMLFALVLGAVAYLLSSTVRVRTLSVLLAFLAVIPIPSLIHDYLNWRNPHSKELQSLQRSLDTAFDEKRYSDAEQICREIKEKQHAGYFVYANGFDQQLSFALLKEKKFDEAINLGCSIVEKDKLDKRGLHQLSGDTQDLARMYFAAKRYSEAGPLFEAALELYRRDNNLDDYYAVVCRKEYAKMLRKMGKTEQAKVQQNEAEQVLKMHGWTYPKCPEDEE